MKKLLKNLGFLLASAINFQYQTLKQESEKSYQSLEKWKRLYVKALQAMNMTKTLDVNFTMRLSYGKVLGY